MDANKLETLARGIRHAEEPGDIREFRRRWMELVRSDLAAQGDAGRNDVKEINRLHDEAIRSVIAWAQRRLSEQGEGLPPVPFALVLFGSGARREQSLWSDQDNGLIYASPEGGAPGYFRKLGEQVTQGLIAAGYSPCAGKVVCSHSLWRKPADEWLSAIDRWLDDPDWARVRYLLVMADQRCIYGSEPLAWMVRNHLLRGVAERPEMLERMLRNTLRHKAAVNAFGRLLKARYGKEAGGVEIKYGAYIPIVNGVRLLAVRGGLRCVPTLERIEALRDEGVLSRETAERWSGAFRSLLRMRLMAQHEERPSGFQSSGVLGPDALSAARMKELKRDFRIARELQAFVRKTVLGKGRGSDG